MDIITLIIGIILLFSKEIHLTKTRSLVHPKSKYAGICLIVLTIIDWTVSPYVPVESLWLLTVVLFSIMFIIVFALASPKNEVQSQSVSSDAGNKFIHIITWTLIGLIGVGVAYIALSSFRSYSSERADLKALDNTSLTL